jgi:hypothetical protein
MTWQTEITPMVRYIIGDIGTTQTYTDAKIQNAVLISAQLMAKDVDFGKTYIVDVGNSGISPDPTDTERDDAFISLVSLKTAWLIANSELRTYALTGMKVTDGPSTIDTTSMATQMKNVAAAASKAYNDAVKQYMLGNAIGAKIVTGPYTTINGNYTNLLGG